MKTDLEVLESEAYTRSFADGIIDLFVGLSILWIGVAWIWLPDIAGLAGIFPAVLVAPILQGRKGWLESRVGYVKWSPTRQQWERKNLLGLFGLGVLALFLGIGVYLLQTRTGSDIDLGSVVAALPAWLIAVPALVIGAAVSSPRILGYAGLLTATGIGTIMFTAGPGWPLLISGIVITVVGVVMVTRFFGQHPVTKAS